MNQLFRPYASPADRSQTTTDPRLRNR